MKLIFLDIDGVLNSVPWLWERFAAAGMSAPMTACNEGMMDRRAVGLLEQFVQRTDARVVVSSSWRHVHPPERIASFLAAHGFTGRVIGATPDLLAVDRCDEIAAWLAGARDVEAYVVLDDARSALVRGHTVLTDPKRGLTDEDVERAITILGARP